MKYSILFIFSALTSSVLFTGCASDNYDSGYNSYAYESPQDRNINRAISQEMNSLSDADIAQLNTLK